MKVEQPYTDHTPVCISCGHEDTVKKNETVQSTSSHSGQGGVRDEELVNGGLGYGGGVDKSGNAGKKGKSKSGKHSHDDSKQGQGKFSKDRGEGSGGERRHPNKPGSPGSGGGSGRVGAHVTGDGSKTMLERDKSCSFVSTVKFSIAKSYFVLECAGPDVPYVLVCSSIEKPKGAHGKNEKIHHRGVADIMMMAYTQNPLGTGTTEGTGIHHGGGDVLSSPLEHITDPFSSTPYLNVLTVSNHSYLIRNPISYKHRNNIRKELLMKICKFAH